MKGPLGFVTVSSRDWNYRTPTEEESRLILEAVYDNFPGTEIDERIVSQIDMAVVDGRTDMMADRTGIVLSTSGSLHYVRMAEQGDGLEATRVERIEP